jgi:hypothetical protein
VEGRICPSVRLFVASCQHLYCWTDFYNVHETLLLVVAVWFRFSSVILVRNKVHFTSVCYDVFTYICHEVLINFLADKRADLEVGHCVPCVGVLNDKFDIWLPVFPCALRAAEVTGSVE